MRRNAVRRTMLVASVAMMLAMVLPGCPNQMDETSKARLAYLDASDTYQATVKILVAYRQAGRIGDDDWTAIKLWDSTAYAGLVAWQEALANGTTTAGSVAQVNAAMQELLRQRMAVQGGTP